jgi:hypothetical protein
MACKCKCLECGMEEFDKRALNHYRCVRVGGGRNVKKCRDCKRREKKEQSKR